MTVIASRIFERRKIKTCANMKYDEKNGIRRTQIVYKLSLIYVSNQSSEQKTKMISLKW